MRVAAKKAAARYRCPQVTGARHVPSPLAGEGSMVAPQVLTGEGCLRKKHHSPILARGNTELPSPARKSGLPDLRTHDAEPGQARVPWERAPLATARRRQQIVATRPA